MGCLKQLIPGGPYIGRVDAYDDRIVWATQYAIGHQSFYVDIVRIPIVG